MNLVLLNDNAQINGGATKIAILNARDLAEADHTVYFLSAVAPIAPELQHPKIHVICSEQHEILSDPNRLRAFAQGWWNFKAARIAKDLFASLDPTQTVVHLHLWAKALSSSVVRSAVAANLPVVCTLHDFLLACPTGTFFDHREGVVCTRTPLSAACLTCNCDTRNYGHKLWRVGRQAIQQHIGWLPNRVSAFIAHSALVADVMQPYLPPNAPIHHIPVFIEAVQQSQAAPADNASFAYAGRLVREKGVLLLARATRAEGLPVVYIGAGDLAPEILTLNPDATFSGWLSHAESVAAMRRARALVFPSLWYETLGLVVLEAAANGIASIVPDHSAARELVVDGVTGLYFKAGDEQDLRSKLAQFTDPQFAARLGDAAYRRFWSSPFSSRATHVRTLESIYRSTLELQHAEQQSVTAARAQGLV